MASIVKSFAHAGVDGYLVQIETNTVFGQPAISIIGMGDLAIKEASERIQAAIIHEGYEVPKMKIVINLAPSDIKKRGSHFDLAMAVGLLQQSKQIVANGAQHYGFIGELSLNGRLRGCNGILSMVIAARNEGVDYLIVPNENLDEASLVRGVVVCGFDSLKEVILFIEGKVGYEPKQVTSLLETKVEKFKVDFSEVRGQGHIVSNAVVAAAGGHNMLLIGEPGCGKSMIALRIPTILPTMSEEEALEVTKIYSVAGLLQNNRKLMTDRPFRAPHHNASLNALIGGGNHALPGEVSLAHNGVLFLDELVEFNRKTLEALRQPMEDKKVTISRVNGTHQYPANFMFVAAMNPCPCGYNGTNKCHCTQFQIKNYLQKLSGPILDRIDIQNTIKPVGFFEISKAMESKSSLELRGYVEGARKVQGIRYKNIEGMNCNAQMSSQMIKEFCVLEDGSMHLLQAAYDTYGFSARTFNKLLRVARTFADLEASKNIRKKDVKHALMAREFESKQPSILV